MSLERESTGGGAVIVDPLGGLLLEPSNELKFKGPFDDYVTVSLMIKNPTEKRIAFKIKTTAPKRYCVKPNSGVLDPAQSMKVNVLLQPFNYDPNEKNKHKFMVQYMYLNDEEMLLSGNDILNMWKDVPPGRLLDLKLKCVFEHGDSIENQKLVSTNQQQDVQKVDSTNLKQTTQTTPQSQVKTVESKTNRSVNSNSDFESLPSSTTTSSSSTTTANNFSSHNINTNTNNNNNNSNSAASRLDKNDNTLNELKLTRQENENLKKEINRLKEEEARLRKLALQSPASLGQQGRQNGSVELLTDLLNNRSTVIIISLLAIIIYLILFR